MTRVTVLMTVLDGARFVDEAIASVIGQDYEDFELLIVDDGSTDATPEILARWSSRDPRVRVIRNDRNLGISRASNVGLAEARGAYIARLDADDLCMPERLRAQVEVLDRESDVVLVSTNYEVIDERGRVIGKESRADPHDVLAFLMHFSNALGGHSQVMYRRDAVLALGAYSEEFEVCVDYDLWSRLVHAGRFVVLPMIGMRYRLHDGRVSVRKARLQRESSDRIAYRMLIALFGAPPRGDEFDALMWMWHGDPRWSGGAARAHRLLVDAYVRCGRPPARRIVARQWMIGAAALWRMGARREAIVYAGYALRWLSPKQLDPARLRLGQEIEKSGA
ncbi:MAG TPA: glycosyltransferase family 2 protein [Thermoanaerobaculia bacterium]|nr:glycosyltransferase family 2 protein [Thermoanaerobaculia bacterium]